MHNYYSRYPRDYNEIYDLYENVSTGRAKAASSGLTAQRPHETAAEIRAQAARARAALSASQERQNAKEARKKELEVQRAAIQPLPSRGIGAEEKVLTRKRVGGKTPYGIARSRLSRLKQDAQNLNIPIEDTLKLHKRIEKLQKAIGNRKKWGTKVDEMCFLLGHLIDEGYVNSIESAIQIAENMSDEWMMNILYE